jgi:apolipoprotein N-acyltransferase
MSEPSLASPAVSSDRRLLLLSLATAALYIASFPNFNAFPLAWVALAPLTLAVQSLPVTREGSCWRRFLQSPFGMGWLAGLAAYAGLFYWLIVTFRAANQSIFLALLALLALSAYLALFWGAWTAFIARVQDRGPLTIALAGGAAWAALEFIRTHLFSGFPWTLLGDSQATHLRLSQIASVTGVYGVSFILCSSAVLLGLGMRQGAGIHSHTWRRAASVVAVLVGIIYLYGHLQLRRAGEPGSKGNPTTTISVAMLQGSIDQYKKWDAQYVDDIKRTYEDLARQASEYHPQLVLWPETSVPGYLLQDPALRQWLDGVVKKTGGFHIVGAPVMHGQSAYNSAFLMDSNAKILGEYSKQHLVPFGEIVPWSTVLGRWIGVLNELGGFAAGTNPPVLSAGRFKVGINICYEAIFPALIRKSVVDGAQLIGNITNDGWYMRTAAPHQHFAPNIFRAIENRRWLVRSDNTGISAIIDPWGRVVAQTPIFKPMTLTGTIYPRADLTFYTRFGDVFAWMCCAAAVFFWIRRRRVIESPS